MRSIFGLIATVTLLASVQGGDVKVEAIMAEDQDSKPTTTFAPDIPKLYCFFKTHGSKTGDTLRGVWIAEDVGDAAPANTKVDEAKLTADRDDFYGAFSLSKPDKGWPAGSYRVEIYEGDDLALKVEFKIKDAAKSKKSKDESDDDSSGD
jgi:hypothetical protein